MVANAQIKLMDNPFHFDVLPKSTLRAFKKFSELDLFLRDKWYLAGGTALALQVGHRRSVDLDFFTVRKKFVEKKIEELLSNAQGGWVTTSLSEGTVYGEFMKAKVSFIAYPFFTPSLPMPKYGTISMMSAKDIAVMKVTAIAHRGRKRDFFDLYWICQNIQPLHEIIPKIHKQYSIQQNLTHVLKSMVYFKDADLDPEPEIYFDASWKQVKSFFRKEIPLIADKLMR